MKKINKDIKKFIDDNLIIDESDKNINKLLTKLALFLKKNKYSIDLDRAVDLINSSKLLNNLIKNIFKDNKKLITKKGIETITNDDNITTLFEAYFLINGVQLDNSYIDVSLSDDIFNDYLKKIDRVSLTREQELSLLKRIRENDKVAYDMFVENNICFVILIAKRYQGLGLDLMDLIQEGTIGLMEAIKRFDIEKGYKFSTYAYYWIKQAIGRAVSDKGRLVRLPYHLYEKYVKFCTFKSKYCAKHGQEPTVSEMCDYLNFDEDTVEELLLISSKPLSLNAKMNDQDEHDDSELSDIIPDDFVLEDLVESKFSALELMKFLESLDLDEKSINVLKLRNGFVNGRIYTLQEIADMYNLTRERIRQIEARSLLKIRRSRRINEIIDYSSNVDLAKRMIKQTKGKM